MTADLSVPDRNDPCPCGSTKKYKHCCMRKDQAQQAKVRAQAAQLGQWLVQARQHAAAGRFAQAAMLCMQIQAVDSTHTQAALIAAGIAAQTGQAQEGIRRLQVIITAKPQEPVLWATLGNLQAAVGDLAGAAASYQTALEQRPTFHEVWSNLGNVYKASGYYGAAIDAYQRAIEIQPTSSDPHANLGAVLNEAGRPQEARTVLEKAIQLNPQSGVAHCNLAAVLMEQEPDQAEQHARRAVELLPRSFEAWTTLGKILQPQSKVSEARAAFARAGNLAAQPGLHILQALMLPTIMGNNAEVEVTRLQFEQALEALIKAQIKVADPIKALCNTNFLLAYHGRNDRAVQQRIAAFYLQACPALAYVAEHCSGPRERSGPRRIGFISRFIARHSVSRCYSHIVEAIARDGDFEVVLISTHDDHAQAVRETYPDFRGTYLRVPLDLERARAAVAQLQLDVLAYLDIGMDPFTYYLAFARLAPTQCVFDGHPVTTGIPNMDYYLSLDGSEPADAQDHYSEQLQRLAYGAYYFEPAVLPTDMLSREALGLPASGRLYVCPMVLFKIHPDFDVAVSRILEQDPDGHVIFFHDRKYTHWSTLLGARFDTTVASIVRSRVHFVPWQTDPDNFLRVIHHSSVILDPFHFGLGSTAIAVCSVGTPFVTLPSRYARGRYAMHCARVLDVEACIAHDVDDYVRIALSIATDADTRSNIRERILFHQSALLGNTEGIENVKAFFRSA